MISFFGLEDRSIFAVQTQQPLTDQDIERLSWLFSDAPFLGSDAIAGPWVGPRAEMITPWSTNATEITQNMGVSGIIRLEIFEPKAQHTVFDPMLYQVYPQLDQHMFDQQIEPAPIEYIDDIERYNQEQGLALSVEEVDYLNQLGEKLGRKLTDAEVFGFSQVNSEHCRHKIFNGTFILDGTAQEESLFQMIKKTTATHPGQVVSAYKDNVAFIQGPEVVQFAPKSSEGPDFYQEKTFKSVLSLKAETHNFPTTVEPFNGAATGSGGEIRDRLAGGKGSIPLAGTAVYMTPYSRLVPGRSWEENGVAARKWLYQTPADLLIKASNGASDFGNKFGQPLINGSLLTFEHRENNLTWGYDKVIMQAGGVGYAKAEQAKKDKPQTGDAIVVLGGDNYRIGMGGAAVSSADTGAFGSAIELNAIQRSNPEMQKRAANAIRALVESEQNPITSIHDHGAGGHLNCLSELIEDTGGHIDLDALPVGDPSLSAKEIIGNESQERMGLVIPEKHLPLLASIAERERAPWYRVGTVSGDHRFTIESGTTGEKPMDLDLAHLFGSAPKTILEDTRIKRTYADAPHHTDLLEAYLHAVLRLEAVASKDWLTNKVDRCVGGRVAVQQCAGPLQLPLNNCGVMALDYSTPFGVATAMGHHPISGLIDAAAGSRNSIAEALTNLVWAPLSEGLSGVSLSANWMWPCNNEGENARLYEAVRSVSDFSIALGINVPTGKDSLSMKQRYPEGDVLAPGTVVISAVAQCSNINQVVEPVIQPMAGGLYYINLSQDSYKLGGSSWAQTQNALGSETPDVRNAQLLAQAFNQLQSWIAQGIIASGHDIGSGGLITTLLEWCFAQPGAGAHVDLSPLEGSLIPVLFAENTGLVFQLSSDTHQSLVESSALPFIYLGHPTQDGTLHLKHHTHTQALDIAHWRSVWFETSALLDSRQTAGNLAQVRAENFDQQPLNYVFPQGFTGGLPQKPVAQQRPVAAILREKGSNSEREMAHALYLAGFEVKDVHMTDLTSGREDLSGVQFIGAVGGFSNSDVLGSAKGWAGAIKYNPLAKKAIDQFFARPDTLSVGICNGCQLWMELDLVHPELPVHGKMKHNKSQKHESGFVSVTVQPNNSVMLKDLAGTQLGVWISHGEGRFDLSLPENAYSIVAKYSYDQYPANPNGSDYNTAMMCDQTGRHLVSMPHMERSIFPWNWAHYPKNSGHQVSPWIEAFVAARKWIESQG